MTRPLVVFALAAGLLLGLGGFDWSAFGWALAWAVISAGLTAWRRVVEAHAYTQGRLAGYREVRELLEREKAEP